MSNKKVCVSLQPPADVNECSENPSICGERICENSYGTYTCTEPQTTQPPSTTTTTTVPAVSSTTTDIPSDKEDENNERSDDEDEDEDESESEIGKVDQREDTDESRETRHKEIDIDSEEVVEASSTSERISTEAPPTTSTIREEISGQSENESGEDSNDDEEDEELHHQSSTIKSDEGIECDDGWRLDSHGKCVGEYY